MSLPAPPRFFCGSPWHFPWSPIGPLRGWSCKEGTVPTLLSTKAGRFGRGLWHSRSKRAAVGFLYSRGISHPLPAELSLYGPAAPPGSCMTLPSYRRCSRTLRGSHLPLQTRSPLGAAAHFGPRPAAHFVPEPAAHFVPMPARPLSCWAIEVSLLSSLRFPSYL